MSSKQTTRRAKTNKVLSKAVLYEAKPVTSKLVFKNYAHKPSLFRGYSLTEYCNPVVKMVFFKNCEDVDKLFLLLANFHDGMQSSLQYELSFYLNYSRTSIHELAKQKTKPGTQNKVMIVTTPASEIIKDITDYLKTNQHCYDTEEDVLFKELLDEKINSTVINE